MYPLGFAVYITLGFKMSQSLFDQVRRFEKQLGLPRGFYEQLLREDDWSFVIKLSALFEGACTHVLTTRLHAPKLVDAFAHLDLLNSKVGKVALLRELDAMSSDQASIIRHVGELRNRLAHNVRNVGFSFTEYVANLDKNQLDKLTKDFGNGLYETLEIGEVRVTREQFVRENPKLSLWLTAAEVIACLYLEFKVAELHIKQIATAEFKSLIKDANSLIPRSVP